LIFRQKKNYLIQYQKDSYKIEISKIIDMYSIQLQDKNFEVEIDKINSNKGTVNGKTFKLDINKSTNEYHIIYNNSSYKVELDSFIKETNEVILKVNNDKITCKVSTELDVLLKELGMDNLSAQKMNDIKAPMPGLVLDVKVDVGQAVQEGDTILVLEAMKMENNIKAPAEGIVKEIICEPSKAVEKNDILIIFE